MPAKDADETTVTTTSRRRVLKAGGVAIVALAGSGAGVTGAQSDTVVLEVSVSPEEEYISLRNPGEEEVDITGYSVNFDAEGGNDQIRELAGEVVVGPGEEITVGTGAQTTIETDVTLVDAYDGHVLNDDGSDVVALLNPDGEVVARSDESSGDDEDDDDETGDGDDGGDSEDEGDSENGEDEEESEDTDDSDDDEGEEPEEPEESDDESAVDESDDTDSQADDGDDCPDD